MRLPPLNTILSFDAVARLGSARKAAQELALTPSAVSHQLANLEATAGVRLFVRSPHGLALTQAGEEYHREIAYALIILSNATDKLKRRNPASPDGLAGGLES